MTCDSTLVRYLVLTLDKSTLYIEVFGVDLRMLGKVEVFFCDKDALYITLLDDRLQMLIEHLTLEEVLMYLPAVCFWNEPNMGLAGTF